MLFARVTTLMETKEIRPSSTSEIRAFLVCGSLLILVGAGVLYLFSLMAFEGLWHMSGSLESQRTLYLYVGLVVAGIVAIGLTVGGFFVARQRAIPFWYVFVTGIIPGFLLFQGWASIHAGRAARKGLQVIGLRRVIIITVIVGLLLAAMAISLFNG